MALFIRCIGGSAFKEKSSISKETTEVGPTLSDIKTCYKATLTKVLYGRCRFYFPHSTRDEIKASAV